MKGEVSLDDYILGSMLIYCDIMVMFIKILKLLVKEEKK